MQCDFPRRMGAHSSNVILCKCSCRAGWIVGRAELKTRTTKSNYFQVRSRDSRPLCTESSIAIFIFFFSSTNFPHPFSSHSKQLQHPNLLESSLYHSNTKMPVSEPISAPPSAPLLVKIRASNWFATLVVSLATFTVLLTIGFRDMTAHTKRNFPGQFSLRAGKIADHYCSSCDVPSSQVFNIF